ncbi:MAG: Bifunctional purine biosynthesis protein PurH [Candidatus Dependentiae bacterium ADurb.Bin331]|nr:MAG: Bifunctional purine biosynthesis protein PurH [Candidatus Dependentiae bacterium ADurb.Bin331]
MKKRLLLLISFFSLNGFCMESETQREKYALLSVSQKNGILPLAQSLIKNNYTIISTGGTYSSLEENLSQWEKRKLLKISDLTGFPEILDGRVKTLHPKIHGAILANRNLPTHQQELDQLDIPAIDVVVVNLYPFEEAIKKENASMDIAVENIDIGGVTLLRAAAKNFQHVIVISDPADYEKFQQILEKNESFDLKQKQLFALKAFKHTARYDAAIANFFSAGKTLYREYNLGQNLKYGLNPYQKNAGLYAINGGTNPFKILNGNPGYVNLLDAITGWQLVKEVRENLNTVCCASYKHVSPAGVGIGEPSLSYPEMAAYDVKSDGEVTAVATAFLRARNGDPKSSFGDFIACSHKVDQETAQLIKREVSDGIIAPGYEPEALEILKSKKEGNYSIIEVDPAYCNNNNLEIRELFGVALTQQPNSGELTHDLVSEKNVVTTKNRYLPKEAKQALLLASIAAKYTQSNSVVYATPLQVIGVGAGQQNRVDCVELAGKKAAQFILRHHPKVQQLCFNATLKRPDRNNAINDFINGTNIDHLLVKGSQFAPLHVLPLTENEKNEFLKTYAHLSNIAVSSDGFFPFEDNVEKAAQFGARYIAQPGGSVRDQQIIEACDKNNMVMLHTNTRLFTH